MRVSLIEVLVRFRDRNCVDPFLVQRGFSEEDQAMPCHVNRRKGGHSLLALLHKNQLLSIRLQ